MTQEEIARGLLSHRVPLTLRLVPVVHSVQAAEDIFQDVVIKALARAAEFQNLEHLLAWARVAARNQAIDHVRSTQRRAVLALDDQVLEKLAADAEAMPDLEERVAALAECLRQLPEKSRQVVQLRYAQGLDGATLAQQLGDRIGAIYQRLTRIHQALRRCVEVRLAAGGAN